MPAAYLVDRNALIASVWVDPLWSPTRSINLCESFSDGGDSILRLRTFVLDFPFIDGRPTLWEQPR